MAFRPNIFSNTFGAPSATSAPAAFATGNPAEAQKASSTSQQSSQACNCANNYPPESGCFEQCNGENSSQPPAPPSSGQCPEGTPAGYADCCPPGPNGQRVWRPDTKTCEYEDDRQKRGEDTCRDNGGLPITCPQGQVSWCNFTTGMQECAAAGTGGASGGSGMGGGGGSYMAAPAPTDPALDQAAQIWKIIQKRLRAPSRYTDQVMQSLAGENKFTSEQQANRLEEQANADAASRGILRSGPASAAQRDIRSDVSGFNMGGWNSILRAKIDADYNDKTTAIKEGMDWINSLRDYIARSAATEAQKQAAMANVMLGYARLQQELAMLREQYGQQINLILLQSQLQQP